MPSNIQVSFEQTKKDCHTLIRQITAHDRWLPDVIFAPNRGGLLLGTMLSHYYDVPLVPFVWQTRDHAEQNARHLADITVQHIDHDILLVDDIYDTGKTIQGIMDVMVKAGHLFMRTAVQWYVPDPQNSDLVQYYAHEKTPEQRDDWIVFCYENWWE